MTTLLISAAVNIGVGLLLNAIFPPPDVSQEGPRLTELGFTSAAYGKFVNIVFGTDRVDGNIIDVTDPAIEEIVNKESSGGGILGKGGGQTVTSTTYTYFLTCRIAFCIEGATALIRWWADGKIIYDNTGQGPTLKSGIGLTFYPGGQTQVQDPEEVSRRGVNIPAYRHLTTIKVDRMPLADYGNRIPNFTAEIAFANSTSNPILNMEEPSGHFFSNIATVDFNQDKNEVYVNKHGTPPTFIADASDLTFKTSIPTDTFSTILGAIGRDGFSYHSQGVSNSGPMRKVDNITGELIGTLGTAGLDLIDDSNSFGNSGQWYQLQCLDPVYGAKSVVIHIQSAFGNANGSVVDGDQAIGGLPIGYNPIVHTMSTADGLTSAGGPLSGKVILDHDRNRFFVFQDDDALGKYNLVQYVPVFTADQDVIVLERVDASLVKTFSRGSISGGDDFEGTGDPAGWGIQRTTGDLLLSNGTSVILYNPDTDAILAQNASMSSFRSTHNYYSGDLMAYGISDTFDGSLIVFDPRDLTVLKTIKTDTLPWPSGVDGDIIETACCWDDRLQALFLSRGSGSDAAVDFRFLKIFLNRVGALGVGLDFVVAALSTTYQRQKMAGLRDADLNVTTLAGDTVLGYTINRQSTMKSALQPLRDRYLFDAHQSDWIMKFPKRGAIPTVTVPEVDVGELKRGRDQNDTPAIQEIRQDDLSLPMSLGVRYRNKDANYNLDVETDKRHLFPNPTMRSKSDSIVDIPLVDQPTAMKQVAQKTLLTLWNERIAYKTVIPWTYIALDATDVFNMGAFGEQAQLRMAENDFGVGWAIEITGVVEDTKSFSSTLAGGAGLGTLFPTIPSTLPTRLFPLNAPVLHLSDLHILPQSNAYMAMGGFEDSWPGAAVSKSIDDTTYTPTTMGGDEVALGRVKTAPGAWASVDGHFANRFQEVGDGGTMVVTMLRRPDVWASAADEVTVLAGANTIAVIRADKQVEILSFQNATVNDDNTVTLTKLLRGRLGTEDVTELGISVSDDVILLSNSTNVQETGPVMRQELGVADMNTTLFFKGVTFGTLLEDAPVTSFTYTGRDIMPYSPVHLAFTGFIGSDLDFTWERRTRGPFAGEWLDLQGEVPLNESIEQYEITLTDGTNSVSKTVNDAKAVTFTEADQNGASPAALVPPFSAEARQIGGQGIIFKSPAMIIPVNTLTLGPTPSIVDSVVASFGSGTTYNVTVPAGTLDDHVLLLFVAIDQSSTFSASGDGFAQLYNRSAGRAHSAAWWRRASSEPASWNFTSTSSQAAVIGVFAIQDAGDPEAWASQGLGSNTVNHFCTSISPVTTRSLLFGHACGGWGQGSYTVPGIMNEEYDVSSGASTDSHVSSVVGTRELDAAGPTGTSLMLCSQSFHYAAGHVSIPAILA